MPTNPVAIAAELVETWKRELGLDVPEGVCQRMARDIASAIGQALEAGERSAREQFYLSNG